MAHVANYFDGNEGLQTRLDPLGQQLLHNGMHFQALGLGIDSHAPGSKLIIGVFSSFNQTSARTTVKKGLAGIESAKQQGKHQGRPREKGSESNGEGRVAALGIIAV